MNWLFLCSAMNTQDNSFLLLGRAGRFQPVFYLMSFTGLILICLSLSALFIPLDVIFSKIQNRNVILAIQLSSFSYVLVLFLLLSSYIHKRPIISFITSTNKFGFKRALVTFVIFLILNSLAELINYFFFNQKYSFQFDILNFIALFLVAVSLLVLQSAAEEIILRGYIFQALSSWKKIKPVVALVISSLLFASLHISNPEFTEYGFIPMFLIYFIAAVFLGAFAILGNGLEIPIGIHAANNFFAAVFVNYNASALKTESLFIIDRINVPLGLTEYIIILLLFVMIFYKMKWISPPNTLI